MRTAKNELRRFHRDLLKQKNVNGPQSEYVSERDASYVALYLRSIDCNLILAEMFTWMAQTILSIVVLQIFQFDCQTKVNTSLLGGVML